MARFLFVVPPLTGHINPTIAVAEELSKRGHDVAWVGYAASLDPLVPAGATVFGIDTEIGEAVFRHSYQQWPPLRAFAALKFLWEDFLIPIATDMLAGVEAAIRDYQPDLLVCDQQALAGPVAARRNGIPWATSATTFSELTDPLASMPKVAQWVLDVMHGFQARSEVAPAIDLRWSDHLVLICSAPVLAGDRTYPDHYAFTGPIIRAISVESEFPWEWLDSDRALVLASLGTLNVEAGIPFYRRLVEAAAGETERIQLVVVAPAGALHDLPENVLVREVVPQLELLRRASAVVTHGGHNTVCEALTLGLPLVVAPIRDDQPVIAERVVAAGAGVRVKFGRAGVGELRDALLTVLRDGSYRTAAQRVADEFAQHSGARTAAELLIELSETTNEVVR